MLKDIYTNPYELCADFDRLIENAMIYFTEPDDPVRVKAQLLRDQFNQQWKMFLDKPEPEVKPKKRAKVVEEDLNEKERFCTFLKKVKASTAYEYLQRTELDCLDLEALSVPEAKAKLNALILEKLDVIPSIHSNTVKALWSDAQRKCQAPQLSDHLDFDALTGWTPQKHEEEDLQDLPTSPFTPEKPPKPMGLSIGEYIRATQLEFVENSTKTDFRKLLLLMFY